LSEDGMLYSMGRDQKKYGILGMGTVYEITSPHPNNNLIDFRISKISMGLSHCCALTTSGQLYSWGTGQNG
jgi:alpha-tubulin suppressor-like RCC1 family protein